MISWKQKGTRWIMNYGRRKVFDLKRKKLTITKAKICSRLRGEVIEKFMSDWFSEDLEEKDRIDERERAGIEEGWFEI